MGRGCGPLGHEAFDTKKRRLERELADIKGRQGRRCRAAACAGPWGTLGICDMMGIVGCPRVWAGRSSALLGSRRMVGSPRAKWPVSDRWSQRRITSRRIAPISKLG